MINTRVLILNNVLKVTLDIVENAFFFPKKQLRAHQLFIFIYNHRIVGSETSHVLLENRAWRILSGPPGILF